MARRRSIGVNARLSCCVEFVRGRKSPSIHCVLLLVKLPVRRLDKFSSSPAVHPVDTYADAYAEGWLLIVCSKPVSMRCATCSAIPYLSRSARRQLHRAHRTAKSSNAVLVHGPPQAASARVSCQVAPKIVERFSPSRSSRRSVKAR